MFPQSQEDSKGREVEVSKLKVLSEGVGQRISNLQATVADLKNLDHTFNDITPRLHAIQSIWRMLITDAQTLRERLLSMPLAGHTKGFILYAKTVQAIYGSLYYALDQYCLAV
ncbi:hypothetical protein BDN72DRAFT_837718 [Pluteus cervinus]|uniref:Uncharacterized protein n=1 Tax=Pluteus cervinus TaxID=181527 RepID=A0ACD3B196_9AGAR|nr:hypothetical protein BDN72DRAFT_837718 [Pluteus cervinus]